jgi:hypothetical protein
MKGIWANGGYQTRFPDTWEEEVRNKVKRDGYCCITEIILHVILESTKIYANTPFADTFLIFHDGLSAWWESEAQQFIADQGFKDRQLRCVGEPHCHGSLIQCAP